MARIEITRTELVWAGKYDENGHRSEVERISLPFQVIESINETRATREAKRYGEQLGFYNIWDEKEGSTFEEGWRNKLIWGDNLLVMSSLLERFAGKIDLIYIDPPFATGADFTFSTQIGDSDLQITKEQSIIEEKAYRDTWGRGLESYLSMISERLTVMRDLLSERGSIYVHCDWRVNSALRLILNEIMDNFQNEIVWKRSAIATGVKTQWRNSHDVILFHSKSQDHIFHVQYGEYSESSKQHYRKEDERGTFRTVPVMASGRTSGPSGQPWRGIDPGSRGKDGMHWLKKPDILEQLDQEGLIFWNSQGIPELKYYMSEAKGVYIPDFWDDINVINSMAKESLGYATQKPEALLERIIMASSDEGSLVADFFCGSGTTCAVAEKLGRRWIGCDLSRYAIHITRKRLLEIENCRPFEILNLGKYERKYWQGVTFNSGKKESHQIAIFEYLAFILKLYGAEPLTGMQHLHGKKGNAMIHIGAIDAPVTIDEINSAINECITVQQKELHILGWEWEMGLYDLVTDAAKGRGIKLLLLTIPREVMEQQAVERGDIKFFELAYLEVDSEHLGNRKIAVKLKDFVIPNTELIPEEVRDSVKNWSDYIDYWAVDWDFKNDTFMNGWVTYRTRRERKLQLESDPHTYNESGKYNVMVKVIDIFGIDTSQIYEVEVV